MIRVCPVCKDAWIYASLNDYSSNYENEGYRVNCNCGNAWKKLTWQKTKEEAISKWNKIADKEK